MMDGKCGLCGDAWDQDPRQHEVGGLYATGTIVRQYTEGQVRRGRRKRKVKGHMKYRKRGLIQYSSSEFTASSHCPFYAVSLIYNYACSLYFLRHKKQLKGKINIITEAHKSLLPQVTSASEKEYSAVVIRVINPMCTSSRKCRCMA